MTSLFAPRRQSRVLSLRKSLHKTGFNNGISDYDGIQGVMGNTGYITDESDIDSTSGGSDAETFNVHWIPVRSVSSNPESIVQRYKTEYERYCRSKNLVNSKSEGTLDARRITKKRKKPGSVISGSIVPRNPCNTSFLTRQTSSCELEDLPAKLRSISDVTLDEESTSKWNKSTSLNRFSALPYIDEELDDVDLDFGNNNDYVEEKWGDKSMFGSMLQTHKRIVKTGITFSQANKNLRNTFYCTRLMKRGFRFRKKWVERVVVLEGKLLKYYDLSKFQRMKIDVLLSSPDGVRDFIAVHKIKPRGVFELSKGTIIAPLPTKDNRRYGFVIHQCEAIGRDRSFSASSSMSSDVEGHITMTTVASGQHVVLEKIYKVLCNLNLCAVNTEEDAEDDELHEKLLMKDHDQIWKFQAFSEEEQRFWVEKINHTINLIQRTELPPTLAGMGSVHDHFKFEDDLDDGHFGFGVFRKASSIVTKVKFTIRIVDKEVDLTNDLVKPKEKERTVAIKRLFNEIRILRKIGNFSGNDGIYPFLGLFHVYEDESFVFCVLDRIENFSLKEAIRMFFTEETYSTEAIVHVGSSILKAINLLHENRIVALNISPKSILFSNKDGRNKHDFYSFTPLLGDFRDSLAFSWKTNAGVLPEQVVKPNHTQEKAHSAFFAPEIQSQGRYSFKGDVYSVGAILYWMIFGQPNLPHDSLGSNDSLESVLPVLEKMTSYDVKQRLTAKEALDAWTELSDSIQHVSLCESFLKISKHSK